MIFALAAQATINKTEFFNAVYNNWHGYGLILKDQNGRLQVLRGFDENGTDPEVVWKLLEDNKDIERFLHVRHSTRGSEDETNVQPFGVYSSNSREVYFMHNGTLHSFGSFGSTGKSDTLEFCEKILTPSLLRWTGDNGKGDYTDPEFYRLIMDKHWNNTSMGLFVSNDLDILRVGSGWSQYKHPDSTSEGEVWVSNTSYFDKVQRGPRFLVLEEERKAREAREKAKEKARQETKNGSGVVDNGDMFSEDYYDWDGYPYRGGYSGSSSNDNKSFLEAGIKEWSPAAIAKSPKILKAIGDIANKWNLEDPEDVGKLNNVTYDEWVDFLDDESPFLVAALLEELSSQISKLSLMVRFLRNKQSRAEKKIAELKQFSTDKKEKTENDGQEAA